MNEKIKSMLANAYMMFIFDFGDPSTVKVSEGTSIENLFDSQKTADRAKRLLGKDGFKKLLALYFIRFQNEAGIDHKALSHELQRSKKVFVRHLGKDKVQFWS